MPLFWLLLLALLLLHALRPIMDFDFWWHLKTGELILRDKALLTRDPFNYTGDLVVKRQEAMFLNAYWLWQVTVAKLFGLFGFAGVFFWKTVTAALLAAAVFVPLRRQQLTGPATLLLVTGGTLIFVDVYHLERPQVFTILFLTVLTGMIARIRAGNAPSRLLWPMMVLWANIHGGFVVGDFVLGLAIAGFVLQYWQERQQALKLVSWAAIGILLSFVNPGGWNALFEAASFASNPLTSANAEYRSTWAMFGDGARLAAIGLWTISLVQIAGLLLVKRRCWAEIFISLFLIAIGLQYVRNTGFIAIALLPLSAYYLDQMLQRIAIPSWSRLAVSAACCLLLVQPLLKEWRIRQASPGPVFYTMPVAMADFLRQSGLSGNLFNDYGLGGYLDWALYPRWQTFIDGRNLDPGVSRHYLAIALASAEMVDGTPLHKLLLDSYGIDVVAMRTAQASGHLQPLLGTLLRDPAWVPVYQDWQTFVLARKSAANAGAIRTFAIDRGIFVETLLQTAGSMRRTSPGSAAFALTYDDARQLKKALASDTLPPR